MKAIAIGAQKGGVGKSTIALHLVHHLARLNHSVLLIDCDTQGNASQCLIQEHTDHGGASRMFEKNPPASLVRKAEDRIFLVPADAALVDIERLPVGAESKFRENVRKLGGQYDYVVIDTPPTMGFAMLAPLVASDYAFSPMAPEPYSIKGVTALFERVEQIKEQYNPSLVYLGILLNRWNRRHAQQNDLVNTLRATENINLIPFAIGERSAISNVAYTGEPVWKVKSGAGRVAAKEMIAALDWIVERTKG